MHHPGILRRTAVAAGACLVLALASCGGSDFQKVYPIKGKILVNGQPAGDCMITLNRTFDDPHPRKVMPYGITNAQGEYKITSYLTDDGAPEGEYVVTIEWRERSGLLKNNYEGIDRLGGAYAKPDATKAQPGFVIKVGKEPLELPPFELKQSPESKRRHEEWLKRQQQRTGMGNQ